MKLKEFLPEKREVIDGVEYWIEPSPQQVLALTKKWGDARWVYNPKSREFLLWDAYKEIHGVASGVVWGDSSDSWPKGLTMIHKDVSVFLFFDIEKDRLISQRYASKFEIIADIDDFGNYFDDDGIDPFLQRI